MYRTTFNYYGKFFLQQGREHFLRGCVFLCITKFEFETSRGISKFSFLEHGRNRKHAEEFVFSTSVITNIRPVGSHFFKIQNILMHLHCLFYLFYPFSLPNLHFASSINHFESFIEPLKYCAYHQRFTNHSLETTAEDSF